MSQTAELRDVPGPSALGSGWRRSLELLYLISSYNFKRTYFGTVLGYVWSLARPLMTFGILLVVFTHIFRLSGRVPHYPVFLLLNIVLFGFFQEATSTAVGSVLGHEAIVRKTQFPRLIIPLSVVVTGVFNLVLNLVVAFAFILAFGPPPAWTWPLLIVPLVGLFVITTAVSMIVSALHPRFRDIGIIWSVASTALFYGTPVLYPIFVPSSTTLKDIVAMGPLAPMFDLAQRWVTNPQTPWPWDPRMGGPIRFAIALGVFAAICVLAIWIFNREAPRIAEEL